MADLTITITIPDAARSDFLDAYAERFGWVDQATSGTKEEFATGTATTLVSAPLKMWRQERAEKAALDAIPAAVDDGITSA